MADSRLDDKFLKELDAYLGSITNDTVVESYEPKRKVRVSALSELGSGQMCFDKLHTNTDDDNCFPVFHPNLICLFSRCIEEGDTSFLTDEQERLWWRYIYFGTIQTKCPWWTVNEHSGGCDCDPYVLPLMTQEIRGGAKLRDGTTLGDVELDVEEGMYVDTTSIEEKIARLEEEAQKLDPDWKPYGETTA